jgi:hypothetical protein
MTPGSKPIISDFDDVEGYAAGLVLPGAGLCIPEVGELTAE